LSNAWILVSTVLVGAIAYPVAVSGRVSWWQRLLKKRQTPQTEMAAAAPPAVSHDGGWTLIHADDPESFQEWLGRDEEGLPTRPGEEPSLGSHLLIELFGCDGQYLETEAYVGDAMRQAAVESKATVVEQSFHEFKPYGVSGAVIIQESHYTIHTWPEHKYAAVDLFYCGGTVLVHRAVEVLRERFKPTRIKFLVVRRGLQGEVERP
jgi:S-adenosylmethionine decarboxylase